MSKYCADCIHMNTKEEKYDGVYKCKFLKDFTNASSNACEKFDKSYGRNIAEKQRLYDLGKEAKLKKEEAPLGIYIFILIVLIICTIIVKLTGN